MSQELKYSINNGNSKTLIVEDTSESYYFWSDYFTQSYEASNDHFLFENSFDLMGNPLSKEDPTIRHNKIESKK